MSVKLCCSLCCTTCGEYKLLQNELGKSNEVYEITVKYFDPMLLTEEACQDSHHKKALCQNCWFHIERFHEFQQTVFKTRMLWEDKTNIEQLPNEVKQEDEQPYASTKYADEENFYKSDSSSSLDHFEDMETHDFKTEPLSSLEDTVDSIAIQTENDKKNNMTQEEEKPKNELDVPTKSRLRKPKSSTKSKANDTEDGEREKITISKKLENAKEKRSSAVNMKKAEQSDAFIAEWKPDLICDLCSESANNFDKLRSHFSEKHKTRFYIKCCERKFFRRCDLVNHIQLHVNPETHKCDICGRSSSTKRNLKLHKKIMHEDTKQLKCDICEKLFKQKVTLERHLLTHSTGSKDFICSECGKGYVAELLLKLHIKHVHNVDRVCDQCGKTLHGFQALKKHLMEHAGIEQPTFRCDICGVELKSANGLKRHKAAYHNDGSTIYVCGVCGKVASSENALWNHKKLVHEEERKHKCAYCDKAFKRPKSLREHIATHTGQDLYQCPHCPQTFKVSGNMHHHRKKVHPVEWEEGRKNRLQQPKINIKQVKKQVVI